MGAWFGMLDHFPAGHVSGMRPERYPDPARLRRFVAAMAALIGSRQTESRILDRGKDLLAALVAQDDWLPEYYARPHPDRYQQYLLHCDSRERFSIVSFVWGPGQATPIHDHRVWGLVGILRGAERVESFRKTPDGLVSEGAPYIMQAGEVEAVSPRIGDIHRVTNAFADRVSVSIHVYGANIGTVRRSVYDGTGHQTPFVSCYADCPLPNIWRAASGDA